ncbi:MULTISPECIES: hypothetical protein [unclassified Streptomyces]|uniref:hypothetical protein n=1 Tax=unclassified Streptomyces TaxID=2593676 RepID=UPI0028C44B12|nr:MULTISPECIES: hypothetical protein [unclassified Streptomyces]WNO71518.1 hypothetical protein RPQ07_07690 [Streptomyces sp. AM8-1-1]
MDIKLGKEAAGQIALLSRAWGVDAEQVVLRLLKHFQEGAEQAHDAGIDEPREEELGGRIGVHVRYAGHRVPGAYDAESESVEILTGPAAGRYKSPSGAATAVIQAFKPGVAPHRNGWSFWIVDATGARLQSLRGSSDGAAEN